MMNKQYYIGFYRFKDTKVWQRSQVEPDKERLLKYLQSIEYIDKESIKLMDVSLPE